VPACWTADASEKLNPATTQRFSQSYQNAHGWALAPSLNFLKESTADVGLLGKLLLSKPGSVPQTVDILSKSPVGQAHLDRFAGILLTVSHL
jgi:hypothetical protein